MTTEKQFYERVTSDKGSLVISDTSANAGHFWAFVVLNDAVLSAIETSIGNKAGLVGITLSAGTVIYGNITSITLASGVVHAHNA